MKFKILNKEGRSDDIRNAEMKTKKSSCVELRNHQITEPEMSEVTRNEEEKKILLWTSLTFK
jgi:hypothetical protein